jgi:anti-sigma factor RsiW
MRAYGGILRLASAGGGPGARATAERGFQIAHWTRGGMRYWLVSDLNPEEFARLAGELRDAR